MPVNYSESDREFMAKLRRERDDRMNGYRERALKMFPPVCGRCGREFACAAGRVIC